MTTLGQRPRQTTLVDLLDRLLDKGVVVAGDATVSVADVDLLFASVRLVLTSVDKAWEVRSANGAASIGPRAGPEEHPAALQPAAGAGRNLPEPIVASLPRADAAPAGDRDVLFPPPRQPEPAGLGEPMNPEQASNGMAQLVVTLADTLREVLEREALRRMERGTLTISETERLGQAFLAMKRQVGEFKRIFNLRDEDLNLDLGPLGKLR